MGVYMKGFLSLERCMVKASLPGQMEIIMKGSLKRIRGGDRGFIEWPREIFFRDILKTISFMAEGLIFGRVGIISKGNLKMERCSWIRGRLGSYWGSYLKSFKMNLENSL